MATELSIESRHRVDFPALRLVASPRTPRRIAKVLVGLLAATMLALPYW